MQRQLRRPRSGVAPGELKFHFQLAQPLDQSQPIASPLPNTALGTGVVQGHHAGEYAKSAHAVLKPKAHIDIHGPPKRHPTGQQLLRPGPANDIRRRKAGHAPIGNQLHPGIGQWRTLGNFFLRSPIELDHIPALGRQISDRLQH